LNKVNNRLRCEAVEVSSRCDESGEDNKEVPDVIHPFMSCCFIVSELIQMNAEYHEKKEDLNKVEAAERFYGQSDYDYDVAKPDEALIIERFQASNKFVVASDMSFHIVCFSEHLKSILSCKRASIDIVLQ